MTTLDKAKAFILAVLAVAVEAGVLGEGLSEKLGVAIAAGLVLAAALGVRSLLPIRQDNPDLKAVQAENAELRFRLLDKTGADAPGPPYPTGERRPGATGF